jgi:CheY-like chemotaxis protein
LADGARLRQVFWNLLNNAIKFTPPSGKITIGTAEARPNRLSVSVSDTGRGIASDALERIFKPFDQGELEGRSHQFGGLGLGLAISHKIVNLHGGELRATSGGVGRGATFTVDLQLINAPPARELATAASRPCSWRVLLVEDHHATRETLARVLRQLGHTVYPARSVAEALESAKRNECDILVSDIGLPDGDGAHLMVTIRTRYGWPGVALSGYGTEGDRRDALRAGFADHLVKPIDVAALSLAITKAMRPS